MFWKKFFFSILTFLMKSCLNLGEHLSVVRAGGFQVCLSHSAYELRVARFIVSGCSWKLLASYLFWPLSMALVICCSWDSSRNDKCRFLILRQWGGSDCWRNLSKPWVLQYGRTWRGGWAPVDLREQRQSQGPQAQVSSLLCFGCGF